MQDCATACLEMIADYSYETYTITAEDIPAYIDSKNTSGEPLGVQIIRTGQQFVQ